MDKEEITEEQQKQSFNYLKGIVYRGYYGGLREVEGDDFVGDDFEAEEE